MAIKVVQWIGSKGSVLVPLSEETYNNGHLYNATKNGEVFIAITETIGDTPGTGSPFGPWLWLTYP